MKFNKEKVIAEFKSLTLIVVVIFAFRSVVVEPYRIPSGSMIPTLNIGDFILVNKFAYGFKLPFSDMFTDPVYLTKFTQPLRGDVLVFKYPKDPSLNYIKRLIGLPGDRIEIIDKQIYINGKIIEMESFDGSKIKDEMVDKFRQVNFNFFHAKTGPYTHVVQTTNEVTPVDNLEQFSVPKGYYFVMGDNRDFSADSRYWGFVPEKNIKGKALMVWFSMTFPVIEKHSFKFRPHRIGTSL
ncbi:MAG: signal peptidase I [Bdellovibrionales bacterium]|jgi:signal peptidase I|nr:signal peptidase I [Bdellovibrionales bacterium]MBT3527439.1 signal peptidase I [Bdellovibrionales bacterium]MBT7669470.1 signal peptidase I [Bdellovibrionales bacterium]MBT7767811.1 signal peptidase I [Bdellovibrionales bacterium]